jgi:hypothetical protein
LLMLGAARRAGTHSEIWLVLKWVPERAHSFCDEI